jgi:dihydrolipoamide dehydrogenase
LNTYDAVIIGAGPGGYVAGIRLGQLGKKALVVDREKPGGVCLNVGCIPSKALINASKLYDKMQHGAELGLLADNVRVDMEKLQAWKDGLVAKLTGGVRTLLKVNGCDYLNGRAQVAGRTTVKVEGQGSDAGKDLVLETGAIVIATGSRPAAIPGFVFGEGPVVDSTGALALREVPARLVVLGGGYIGMEIGTLYAKLGSHVTIVEALGTVLPGTDPDLVSVVTRKLKKMGVEVLTSATATGWRQEDGHAVVSINKEGAVTERAADTILVAVGRRPNTEGLGLEEAGVRVERGFIPVNDRLETNVPGLYAIGDVAGQPMLAHKASTEAEVVASVIAGKPASMAATVIPSVIFTDPEIASAGLSEEEAKKATPATGQKIKVGKFPFAALGRALANQDTDGFAKVLIDQETGKMLGVHVVGNGAGDMIAEAALALEMGAQADDVAMTIHAHPTLPEAIREAVLAAKGEAVHIQNR